jgi:hypothetical protein
MMRFPDSYWPFGFKLPTHDPAISIARQQATVLAHKANAVYLGSVPS